MMNKLVISWEMSTSKVIYFVNNAHVGVDDPGFDKILEMISRNKRDEVVIKISYYNSLGSDDLVNTLPFKDRFDELKMVIGSRKIIYEFFPDCC